MTDRRTPIHGLRVMPSVTMQAVHDRLCAVEQDVGEMKPSLARVETSLGILAKLAEEDRAERRQERGVSLQRRAATENLEGQIKLERISGRNKIFLAIIGLLATGGGLGALVSSLAGCS